VTGDRKQDRYALAQRVIALVEEDLAADGYELLDVRVFRGGGRLQLRLYVDAADGVDLGDCARASRTVSMLLEEADVFSIAYVIEVSSPGVRRPLRTTAHFAAAVGQNVELRIARRGKPDKFRGKLLACRQQQLVLQQEAESGGPPTELRISLDQLLEANLDPEFDVQALIGADRRRRKAEKRERREQRRRKSQ
jgi:ribosome maturation factor RimP